MRKFGQNLTKYFEFQLEGDDRVYGIPLAASMPFGVLEEMSRAANTSEQFTAQVKMLREYMGDAVDKIPVETLSEILKAWAEESNNTGTTVGES